MASSRICARKNGSTYTQILWREGGKQRSLSFDDHASALRFERNIDHHGPVEALRILGIEADTQHEMTLTDWLEHHCDTRTGIEKATVDRYRRFIARDIAPTIGHMPLSSVAPVTISRWVQSLEAAGASAKTVKNKHGFLSGALAHAMAEGRISRNPCAHTTLARSDSDEMTFLTGPEFAAIHSHMTARWQPFFTWLVCTGMRFGEATALTVGDVDPVAKTCRINKAWKEGGRLGLTKSRKGQRTINVPADALAVADLSRPADALLWTTEGNGRIKAQLAHDKGWQPALDKAIADGLTKPRRPRIHDLRHTCASWMIAAGVPLPVIQQHLGHESIQTTVDRYGHLDTHAGKAAADAIAAALKSAPPQ